MNVEKIREDQFKAWWERTVGNGQWTTLERLAAHDAWMAALSSLDPEAIRREKAEEIYQAGMRQGKWFAMNTGPLKPVPVQPTMDESITSILSAEPAQDDGKAEVGDVVMLIYNDGSQGPREWTRWLADHSPLEGDVPAVRCVILMRAAEVRKRLQSES